MRKNAWTVCLFTVIMGAATMALRYFQLKDFENYGSSFFGAVTPFSYAVFAGFVLTTGGILLMGVRLRGIIDRKSTRLNSSH